MIYRRVSIHVSEVFHLVKYVLASEIPVLSIVWGPSCVTVDRFAFKLPRVKFLLDGEEYDRLRQKYNSEAVHIAVGPRDGYR